MLTDYERIEHVNVQNDTSIYEDQSFIPDVIIWINGAECSAIMECHGVLYEQTVQAGEDTFIFEKMRS